MKRTTIALAVLAVGFIMLAVGTLRGEMQIVFETAATVCLECIGIG